MASRTPRFVAVEIVHDDYVAGGKHASHNLYVTGSGMWSETYRLRCLEIVGPERLLFSTDYPYQRRPGGEARRVLEAAPLDWAGREAVAYRNWNRLTGRVP